RCTDGRGCARGRRAGCSRAAWRGPRERYPEQTMAARGVAGAGVTMPGARIAVVGGGLAGLAAAIECADAGAEVTLYEARRRLGGATFSVDRNGHWIDNGQHILLRCRVSYGSFLRRLGVERLVAMQPRLHV